MQLLQRHVQVGEAEYESAEHESQERGAEREEQNPPPQAMTPGEDARLIEAGTGHGEYLGTEKRTAKPDATPAQPPHIGMPASSASGAASQALSFSRKIPAAKALRLSHIVPLNTRD